MAARAFLALGAALIAVHFLFAPGSLAQAMTYQAVGFVSFLAVVAGILLHRPERTLHLWLFAAGLGLLSLGDAIWNAYDYLLVVERPFPSVADWAYLGGYAAIVAAMLFLLRSRQRPTLSDVLDGAIVLAGAAVLIWFALMKPVASDGSLSGAARFVSTLYPAADVLLLIALAQLILTAGARSFSFRALTLGAAVLFATDIVYGLQTLNGTYVAGGWLDAGWMISTTLWGAAVLHPSIVGLHRHASLRDARLTWRRLALLAAAALVTPVVILLYHSERAGFDAVLIAVTAAATTLLIFARMALLFREHGRAIASLRDAEAEREAAELLQVSNDRFQSAARALDCAIYEWDPERDRIQWSEGLAVAFGHDPVLVDSSNAWFLDRVHPDDREAVAATLGQVLAGVEQGQSTYRFRTGDGTYRDVWDRWTVRKGVRGEVLGIVGGMVDVTDRRALEARLQRSEKMEALGRLAGGVAHDFNNLLTAISGNAELLQHASPDDPAWREDVAEITRAAGRAAELTSQLLTFSRGGGPSDVTAELDRTVGEMATMLDRLLGDDVAVELDLGAGSAHVACDATQLEQVVLNLALNARDAMPGGGTLRIETGVAADRARLVVSDDGVGMDAETAARIFEPFFTTKHLGEGTGLGLATVYGAVEQAGGSITVQSSPGAGTSFELLLPRRGEDAAVEAQPHVAPREACSGAILVVEDEDAVRAVVARMLEQSGYSVTTASSPLAALSLLESEDFRVDVLVSDVVMPQLSGFALAGRVEQLRPGLPIVFITGYTGTDERPEELERHPIVRKPFGSGELLQAVRGVLETPLTHAA